MRIVVASLVMLVGVAAPEWTAQTSGVTTELRGISAVNDKVAWASGASNTILRTEDGGTTWRRTGMPTIDPLDFRDIDAVSERVAYVLSIGDGALSRIYKTSDAGATWDVQFINEVPTAFYDAMAFWDADHGIAVSDSVQGEFVIITTSNGGRTWTRVPADKLPPALPNEGAFAASGTNVTVFGTSQVWFGTGAAAKSRVLRSADRGATWEIADTPLAAGPTAGIYSIAFRDANHGVVVGGDYMKAGQAVDNVAVTSDGGRTWTLTSGLTGLRSAVAAVPGTTGMFLAAGPLGSNLSTDDGKTWSPFAGPGFHTFGFAPGKAIGWGAGPRGSIGRLDLK